MTAFFVSGVPQPQGSKSGFIADGRAVVVDKNPKMLKPWRKAVTDVARATWEYGALLEGPVRVEAVFVLPRPKSVKRALPHVRPDSDKLARSILDSVTDAGNVWRDDAQVVQLHVSKIYGEVPGVHVNITRVEVSA